ncbi:hypothetical protein [Anaeromyxobacter terrae]|uniref:hypothetical protein n=1 Tax=Anaeromyxobacter terrae TaxID=2925406 RepID=UPI001F59AFDA|nr:hypothetical protein [Anaeromyxobacter sp. SG22]
MDAHPMDLLPGELDALGAALDEERFRHVAGLEPEPALARPFAARPHAAHRDTVKALREAGDAPLAARVGALRAERAQAEDEEAWRAAEAQAAARGPDGRASLAALEIALLRERDRARRLELAGAAAEALAPAASLRERAAEARARARAEVGLAPDWRIVVEGDATLAASDDAWRDVLAFAARRELGLAPHPAGDLGRADLLHLVEAPRYDGLFRPGMLPIALELTLEPLGLDLGGVRIDDAARPAKWPGAHAVGARVSFRPRGGAGDWHDLLAAVARAFAARAVRPHLREPVLGEALAWLLGSLLLEPRWLHDRADVERRQATDVVRALALRRLLALRADAAALRVATEVERGLSGAAWREAHREALTSATGAEWELARASRDADAARLGAALAGAGAGEALRRGLVERFDEDWWRNPRTAAHLAGLLAAGRLPDAAEPPAPVEAARRLAGKLEGR